MKNSNWLFLAIFKPTKKEFKSRIMPIRNKKKVGSLINLTNYSGIWIVESSFLEI